jgi:release factor glutamine methyltransferase
MKIHQFKKQFFSELSGTYPHTEVQSFFNLLVEFKLELSRVELALQPNLEIDNNDLFFFQNALSELKIQKPIQYIIGETTFYGLPFNVNKHVLIPRSETEELVAWIIKDCQQLKNIKILDIGTGSGCIAISLSKNLPNAEVYAIDVSPQALKVAQNNSTKNQVNIQFIEADILVLKKLPQSFDIIVSNPPYVRELEKEKMQQNVLANEPHLALFVKNENPLLFYEKISELAKSHLTNRGSLYVEINQYLGAKTIELFESKGFKNIQLKKDLYGADRMIKVLNVS